MRGRAARIAALVALAGLATPGASAAAPIPASDLTITVDAAAEFGPTNQHLLGVGWNTGSLDGVAPLHPPAVRIDGSLHEASTGPGALDLDPLLARVEAARSIGAEPQVILSYMPPWLARTWPGDPRDPTRLAPRDPAAWQGLVETVVESLATAPDPAFRFEVWNEPDLPVFWQDSPADFIELARRTHAAIAAVEARTGLDLQVGGPAAAFPDAAWIVPYAQVTEPDFVSWHFYGNHPFFGPDGNEGFVPDPVYQANARRNPLTSPSEFASQTEMVRSWVGLGTELTIDEWNVAAGGFDTRHDTHEGAAFDAAVLTEMERAGLDAADFYRSSDTPGLERRGEWGLVDGTGERKPAWWVFDAFHRAQGIRIGLTGDAPALGVWGRASRGRGGVDVILSSFTASGLDVDRRATVAVEGARARCAVVRTLATPDGSLATGEEAPVVAGTVTVGLPHPSVVWIRFRPEPCPPRPPR
ncbi:MAG: hypothetical protein HYU28_09290 [Actinobacteria bacterium]|nr:hypothetical protein [Actinomycetota bacterium]